LLVTCYPPSNEYKKKRCGDEFREIEFSLYLAILFLLSQQNWRGLLPDSLKLRAYLVLFAQQ